MKLAKILLLFSIALSALLLVSCGGGYRTMGSKNIKARMSEFHDCTVIDVRSAEAFRAGHVPDAVNIPLATLDDATIAAFAEKINPVIVYGETEGVGNQAARTISELGYENVYTFGAMDAWRGDVVTEEDPLHVHLFYEKETTGKYFVKDATRNDAAIFRYSCECGEMARYKTFTHGRTRSELLSAGKNAKSAFDGKKILFIGDSTNVYGKLVNSISASVKDQASRMNDTGYFYELCKQNGASVNVTNWSFDNHLLSDILSGHCTDERGCAVGYDHLCDLTDRNYDYVYFADMKRATGESAEEYLEEITSFMKIFTDVNPNCKFIFSIPSGVYWYNHQDKLGAYDHVGAAKALSEMENVIVVDWGRLVYDLVKRDALLPDSTVRCTETSLLTPDGQYPNLLSGYIAAVMTYCTVTGESAVGQPIHLENGTETGTATRFQMSSYIDKIYRGKSTNFVGIMSSDIEMHGIQQLIDRYLDMETYLYYN